MYLLCTLCFALDANYWYVNPFIILGIVIIICGVMFGAFTIETCMQLRLNMKRMTDKDIDNIKNLHHIKHWIEPGKYDSGFSSNFNKHFNEFPDLIPFGWGHDDGINDDDGVDNASLKDDNVYAGNSFFIAVETDANPEAVDDNPHIAMKNLQEDSESIPKEIFDESLRYSDVDRPRFSISKSSPIPQRRGSFSDPEERIANLFSNKPSGSA